MFQLLKVLWSPSDSFSALPTVKVSWLVLAFVAFELFCCLLVIDSLSIGINKAMASNPAIGAGARPVLFGFVIVISSLINLFIVAIMAAVFAMLTFVLGGKPNYRMLFGMLLLAYSPILLNHFTRNLSYMFGWISDPAVSLLSLANMIPAIKGTFLGDLVRVFDLFDVWTLVLVACGFALVSGLRKSVALPAALVVWLTLQMVFFRIQSFGAVQ